MVINILAGRIERCSESEFGAEERDPEGAPVSNASRNGEVREVEEVVRSNESKRGDRRGGAEPSGSNLGESMSNISCLQQINRYLAVLGNQKSATENSQALVDLPAGAEEGRMEALEGQKVVVMVGQKKDVENAELWLELILGACEEHQVVELPLKEIFLRNAR